MFDRFIEFVARTLPFQDRGVDPKDVLNVVRPRAAHNSLDPYGGWGERIFSFTAEARKHPLAWTVNADGDLVYDLIFFDLIQKEFAARGKEVAVKTIEMIERTAQGHVDYVNKMSLRCWHLEKDLTQ